MYNRLVFWLAKLCQVTVRRFGRGGGTALPGLLAERLSKRLLIEMFGQLDGSIVVVGTNGKTTTSRLLSSYLEGANYAIVHNRSGSNLVRGVLSSLIADANWRGQLKANWGLFEVDEAAFPQLLTRCTPSHVLALNLFRDQLDRYGEVDSIAAKWQTACATLPASSTLIVNADDPLMAHLVSQTSAQISYFGLDFASGGQEVASYADSRQCPVCGARLVFTQISYSHLGTYHCPNGDFKRPEPTVLAAGIQLHGMSGSHFKVMGATQSVDLEIGLAGLYNVYNVAAAMSLAWLLNLPTDMLKAKTRNFQAVFGRLEKIQINGVELVLILVKNPTGFNQVIQTLQSDNHPAKLWLVLNDRFADGRDVSWIWDVEFEKLTSYSQAVVSGSRAYDMAVRLKYAGFSQDGLHVLPGLTDGLRQFNRQSNGTVYCLCTYTAMLELRQLLQKNRAVRSYHGS